MIYQSNLIQSLLASSTSVATAAGVASMANRVSIRIGEDHMVGSVNMGRLPCIYVRQVSVSYDFEAEPTHEGTRSTDWVITLLVPTFLNRSDTQYQLLESIKQAVLVALTASLELGLTNVRESIPTVTQMSTQMDITFTTETSYNNNYSEGT